MSASRRWPDRSRIRPPCRSLNRAYHSGPASLSIASSRDLALVQADIGPGRQQRRRQIVDRPARRQSKLLARGDVLLLLDGTDAEHQPGDPIALVGLHHALGEPDRVLELAVGQQRQESAVEKFRVARIATQRRAVIERRRRGITLDPGMAGGEIAARHRHARKDLLRLGARIGRLRRRYRDRQQDRGDSREGGHARSRGHAQLRELRDHGSSTPLAERPRRGRMYRARMTFLQLPCNRRRWFAGPNFPKDPLKAVVWLNRDRRDHMFG